MAPQPDLSKGEPNLRVVLTDDLDSNAPMLDAPSNHRKKKKMTSRTLNSSFDSIPTFLKLV